jgi:GDP-L-fucose synthase
LLDVARMAALGWRARIGLRRGLEDTWASFLAEKAAGRLRT